MTIITATTITANISPKHTLGTRHVAEIIYKSD